MKQTVRLNTFETNSSSTHSCIICTAEEYDALRNGLMYVYKYGNDIYSKEQLENDWKADNTDLEFEDWLDENDYVSLDDWGQDYEWDDTNREINGQKIYALCYYGQDY